MNMMYRRTYKMMHQSYHKKKKIIG